MIDLEESQIVCCQMSASIDPRIVDGKTAVLLWQWDCQASFDRVKFVFGHKGRSPPTDAWRTCSGYCKVQERGNSIARRDTFR